jgi:hypothetical protein
MILFEYKTKENKYPCGCIIKIVHIGEQVTVNFCPEHQIPSLPNDAIKIYIDIEEIQKHRELITGLMRRGI